jgi:hypothetical protein
MAHVGVKEGKSAEKGIILRYRREVYRNEGKSAGKIGSLQESGNF